MCCIQHQQPVRRGRAPPLQRRDGPSRESHGDRQLAANGDGARCIRATGAMERRCHTADHSLSAESCNGTPFSGILMSVWHLDALDCWNWLPSPPPAGVFGPPARDLRSPGAYFVCSSLQPRYSASLVAAAETGIMAFSYNRGPLVAFRVDQARRTAISIELAGISSNVKYEKKHCTLRHRHQRTFSSA